MFPTFWAVLMRGISVSVVAAAASTVRTVPRPARPLLAGCLVFALTAATPQVSSPTTVVPSAGLPAEVHDNRSNNNVHAIAHDGRIYMVFRTAKWHIASDDAAL